jgi:hypothetical protein
MAVSTWLGETLPEEQAEPAPTSTSSRSSAISWRSAPKPGAAKQSVCGSRSAASPKMVTPAASTKRRAASSRHSAWAESRPSSRRAISAAAPKPAIPGVFSVPARRPRSWPPPWVRALTAAPSA